MSLAALTAADFEATLDTPYRLSTPDAAIELRLAEVRRLGFAKREGGAFTLTFVAPRGPFLPQAIYTLDNERLDTLEIFLVPIGPVGDDNGYEAVFG